MAEKVDYLIIGGGILGLSIGIELLNRNPRLKVIVAEKESGPGVHASGRNSGVLHAGFYYSADSLKAKFCADGNRELRALINKYSIPILECGKVVVAKNDSELSELEKLHSRGLQNGVIQEILPENKLQNFEPLARTHKAFLWSPTTAVSDPSRVIDALKHEFISKGGELKLNAAVKIIVPGKYEINGKTLLSERAFNVSGTNAIHLAHNLEVGTSYDQLPVLGLYKISTSKKLNLQRLVYPVPDPNYPFLGVHFTLTLEGDVKIGPTAIPVLGGEQYSVKDGVSMRDLRSSLLSARSLLQHTPKLLLSLAATELPHMKTKNLVNASRELVPSASVSAGWHYKKPGIRAQLVQKDNGKFVMDFLVETKDGITHVLNAVSPGWTAAIPFAKHLVENCA